MNLWETIRILFSMIVLGIWQFFYPSAYVDMPFSTAIRGSIIEMNIHVSARQTYRFNLNLYFRKNDFADRERVRLLAEGTPNITRNQSRVRGIEIPVRLSIGKIRQNETVPLLSQECTWEHFSGFTADYYETLIGVFTLERGDYHVKLESLQDVTELDDVVVHFQITTPMPL